MTALNTKKTTAPQLALAEILLTVPDLPDDARQVFQALVDLLSKK